MLDEASTRVDGFPSIDSSLLFSIKRSLKLESYWRNESSIERKYPTYQSAINAANAQPLQPGSICLHGRCYKCIVVGGRRDGPLDKFRILLGSDDCTGTGGIAGCQCNEDSQASIKNLFQRSVHAQEQ